MATRRKRCNGDSNIRRLERKMLSTEDKQDVIAYWKACINSNVLPLAQKVDDTRWYIFEFPTMGSRTVEMYFWHLDPKKTREDHSGVQIRTFWDRLTKQAMHTFSISNEHGYINHDGSGVIVDKQSFTNFILSCLAKVIKTEEQGGKASNPKRKKRKNADDDIRRLERAATDPLDVPNVINYWRACIRANILPKPTMKDHIGPTWFFGPYRTQEGQGNQYLRSASNGFAYVEGSGDEVTVGMGSAFFRDKHSKQYPEVTECCLIGRDSPVIAGLILRHIKLLIKIYEEKGPSNVL